VTATLPSAAPEAPPAPTASRPSWLTLDTTKIVFLAWIATFVVGAILVSLDGGNLLSQANLVKMLTA
jgi:hypothetical protein